MGWFRQNQHYSAITVIIDRLSNTDELEWFYPLQQLMEVLAMQVNGAKEAIQVIDKRLKQGTPEQQLNLIQVLNYLAENSNHRILYEIVATSKLKSRFKWMMKAKIPHTIKLKIITLLKTWIQRYDAVEPRIHRFNSVIELGYRRINEKPELKPWFSPSSVRYSRFGEAKDFRRLSELSLHSSASTSLSPTGTAVDDTSPLTSAFSSYSRRQLSQPSNRHSYVF
ncbi:hypothetical protein DM01DRAFT_1382732 [Hesseltinella vesiculosa]|uniref:VHS domain-containing protein n=1 Tax=Hesseltinella vesiculosa TaxID=101127 RepID=A0A1X2GJS0_9FUNG|nr:hypothetical protein DM01DRAFT_1382732 [Hesseltinella vesiculosa]